MQHRRVVAFAMLVFGLGVTPANAVPGRSLSLDYTGAGLAGVGDRYVGAQCGLECLSFTTAKSGERTLTITATDTSGRSVGWFASSGRTVTVAGCGTGVIASKPGQTWQVQTAALAACNGVPTKGRLIARLTR